MKKRLDGMSVGKRLKYAFSVIIAIIAVVNVVGLIIVFTLTNRYNFVLDNYAFPQGTIGRARTALADSRAALRGLVGYEEPEHLETLKASRAAKKEELYGYLPEIQEHLVSKEGIEAYAEIEEALEDYFTLADKIVAMADTTDQAQRLEAEHLAIDELVPVYRRVEDAFTNLMEVNLAKGEAEHFTLKIMQGAFAIGITAMTLAVIIISERFSKLITKSIAEPLDIIGKRIKAFSEGDLSSEFPEFTAKDEITEMVNETRRMAMTLKTVVGDVEHLMEEMANGNFAVRTQKEDQYAGEMKQLLLTIRKMNSSMSATLLEVDEAAKQVEAGASNMAEAAQSLAGGATEQATSVQEMQTTIANLTEGVSQTAEHVEESYEQAQKYSKEAEMSRGEMETMVAAMVRISETSKNIGNIVSEIEDIASQTNLLSLNASIEAARAGEAGKGFAVVADQIRNLAEQSAKSAIDTRELIEGSLREVEEGNKAAQRAAESLAEVVKGVDTIADSSSRLSNISVQQAAAMGQAEDGVNRISEVVQSNSAMAEQTSATSQELSAQATALAELVGRFKLRE